MGLALGAGVSDAVGAADGALEGGADGGPLVGAGPAGPDDTTSATDVPTATR